MVKLFAGPYAYVRHEKRSQTPAIHAFLFRRLNCYHFEYPQKTLQSIHDALRPGGKLVLVEFQRIEGKSSDWVLGHVRAGQETFVKEVTEAGFRQIEEKPGLLSDSYLVVFERTP